MIRIDEPVATLLFALAWLCAVVPIEAGQDTVPPFELPESPVAGGRLFMEKGCVSCHAIHGLGGAGGPDLGKIQAAWTFLDIAGVMWNHDPKMEEEFKRRNLVRPKFTSEEMYQLVAFVYFLNYFGNPGDAAKGELVFLRKNCIQCHTVSTQGPEEGIALDEFQIYRSPAFISAALWNACKGMTDVMQERGFPRPVYEANDLVDILAFIRREADPIEKDLPVYLPPGNTRNGSVLFREKGCIHCHSVRGEGGDVGPPLGSWASGGVLSQMAGAIWNHGPEMWKSMEEAEVEYQKFSETEMSDLMTYLYFANFIDPPGDPQRGMDLFTEKGCVVCHAVSKEDTTVGPMVSEMKMANEAEVIAAMWNHASEMIEVARAADVAWPQFRSGEMADVVAFIRSQGKSGPLP